MALSSFSPRTPSLPPHAHRREPVLAAFRHCRDYAGEVPGTTAETCGNFRLHDLAMAKWEAAQFVARLEKEPCFDYPTATRVVTEKGLLFHDS